MLLSPSHSCSPLQSHSSPGAITACELLDFLGKSTVYSPTPQLNALINILEALGITLANIQTQENEYLHAKIEKIINHQKIREFLGNQGSENSQYHHPVLDYFLRLKGNTTISQG